jgi:signal transduction histidine kinase
LRRWRWFVLFFGVTVSLVFEGLEHVPFDAHLLREVLLYGLIVPAGCWVLLTVLADHMARSAQSETLFELHRRLSQQLEQYQDWHELSRFVTRFPSTFLPVDHASLFLYDHSMAQLRYVTEWNAASSTDSPVGRYLAHSPLCSYCLASKSPFIRHMGACRFASGSGDDDGVNEYCQPLSYDGLLVGVRWLRCQPGQDLAPDQIEFLNATAPQIALALALSIVRRRQMAQTRDQAQLDERRRVAYELHDSLGQIISYLHLNLDRLAGDRRLLSIQDVQHDLERMRRAASDAYERVRSNLWILRSWETADLTRTIADYAQATAQNAGIEIDLVTEGQPALLSPEVSYQIFGLVREGLNNVVTHAHAQRAQIKLVWSSVGLSMTLIDDGVGFDPAAVSQVGHYGLAMMRERAQALHGELTISSAPGHGTRLMFEIPIQSAHFVPDTTRTVSAPEMSV